MKLSAASWGMAALLGWALLTTPGSAWARAWDGGPDIGPGPEAAPAEKAAAPVEKARPEGPLSADEFTALFNETYKSTIRTPDWNVVEEPATRPYKAFVNGVGAVGYQTARSFVEGNQNLPIIGSVEALRGFRRGAIAMVEGTYKSMAGAPPMRIRDLGQTNKVIENEPFLNFAADALQGLPLSASYSGTERGAAIAAGVFAAQKATDYSPVAPQRDERKYESQVRRAQRTYLGEQARVNEKQARGNLLKRYGGR